MMKQGLDQKEAKRKLASIQKIEKLRPIPDADAIVAARILGWDVVVRKEEFDEGDLGVYFEIDSFLPPVDEYSFLGKVRVNPITRGTSEQKEGYKLSTTKLRGQISQGLFVSFDKLNFEQSGLSKNEFQKYIRSLELGTDVSESLGVTKWEIPEVMGSFGSSSNPFPSQYTSKTDEERIQNMPDSYLKLKGQSYYGSSKYDGTSITIIKDKDEIIIASRNLTLDPGSEIEKFIKTNGLYDRLLNYDKDIVLQSEFYGEGIQSNRLGIAGRRLATFNIEINNERLGLLNMIKVANELNLELPVIVELGTESSSEMNEIKDLVLSVNENRAKLDYKTLSQPKYINELMPILILNYKDSSFNYSPSELLDMVNEMKYLTNGSLQEGVVFRSLHNVDAWDPISFKAISNKFLLKHD